MALKVDIRVPVGLPVKDTADFIAKCEDAGHPADGCSSVSLRLRPVHGVGKLDTAYRFDQTGASGDSRRNVDYPGT